MNWEDPEAVKAYKRERYRATIHVFRARYAAKPEYYKQKTEEFKKRNPTYAREWHLKRYYGMTLEDYASILATQDGKCALCLTSKPGGLRGIFVVDHDHTTNKVRGLLCDLCNRKILPLFERDPTFPVRVTSYLKSQKSD